MMKYTTVLFDLDGTLTKSGIGIKRSFEYALKTLFPDKSWEDSLYDGIVGPPLSYSFKTFFGLDEETSQKAILLYRERYSTVGLFENELYDGVEDMLKKLYEKGIYIALATSKPYDFAVKILEHFNIKQYFSFIGGATMDGKISSKTDVLLHTLNNIEEKSLKSILMVGDKHHDLEGAHNVGVDCVGVLYGYGTEAELLACPHRYIANSAKDIYNFIINS